MRALLHRVAIRLHSTLLAQPVLASRLRRPHPFAAHAFSRGARALCGAASVTALGGCILTTDIPDPALDVPPAYKSAGAAQAGAPPALDWWRGFRSAELTALMEEAQMVNLDIAAAAARMRQADALARIAGAPLLPIVSGDFDVTRSRASGASTTGNPVTRPDITSYRAALTASYEIDFWGKNRDAALAAEESANASRFERDVVTLSTLAAVANAYFQVVAAQDRIRVANNNIASAQRVYNAIQQRVNAGTSTDLELAQQQSLLANQRASLPALRLTLSQNMNVLATLVARPPESIAIKGGSLVRITNPRVTPGLPSELLNQRPDIRRGEAVLASTTASVGSARAQFFPSIQLTGQGGYQSFALKALFMPESALYSVAAGLTQPIFDGFRIQSNFELQQARQEEALQVYRGAVVAAFADVNTALVAVAQANERVRLQLQVIEASRRAFQLAQERFDVGTIDIITVLSTQLSLFQAEDALALARLARLLAVVSLFQALGGGWAPLAPNIEPAGQIPGGPVIPTRIGPG